MEKTFSDGKGNQATVKVHGRNDVTITVTNDQGAILDQLSSKGSPSRESLLRCLTKTDISPDLLHNKINAVVVGINYQL